MNKIISSLLNNENISIFDNVVKENIIEINKLEHIEQHIRTPLMIASENLMNEHAKILLKYGADLNIVDCFGNNSLSLAGFKKNSSFQDYYSYITLLIEQHKEIAIQEDILFRLYGKAKTEKDFNLCSKINFQTPKNINYFFYLYKTNPISTIYLIKNFNLSKFLSSSISNKKLNLFPNNYIHKTNKKSFLSLLLSVFADTKNDYLIEDYTSFICELVKQNNKKLNKEIFSILNILINDSNYKTIYERIQINLNKSMITLSVTDKKSQLKI